MLLQSEEHKFMLKKHIKLLLQMLLGLFLDIMGVKIHPSVHMKRNA
jgi:hypothetical protein